MSFQFDEEVFSIEYLGEFQNESFMCKKFGCGKKLSLKEQLHSDYCLKHQPEKCSDEGDYRLPDGCVWAVPDA